MDKEQAISNLVGIQVALSINKKKFFLIDGTLLGAIREGDFIDHDNDTDIGVYMEEWEKKDLTKLTSDLMKIGFKVLHQFGELGKYFELAVSRNGVKTDLFFYKKEKEKRIFHAFLRGGKNIPEDLITFEYPAELIEKTKKIYFKSVKFPIPKYPEKVLKIKYGENWRVPNQDWDWAESPKNRV